MPLKNLFSCPSKAYSLFLMAQFLKNHFLPANNTKSESMMTHSSSQSTVIQKCHCVLLLDSESKEAELWLRTVRGVNPQVDGDGRYAFVGPRDAVRLGLDLLANLIEVCELLPFAMEEFSPFWEDENGEYVSEISGGSAACAREENNASVRGKKARENKQYHLKRGRLHFLWMCVCIFVCAC